MEEVSNMELCRLRYLKSDPCPPNLVSWRFYPGKKGGKITESVVVQELFDQGMDGNLYCSILKVPSEWPTDDLYPEYVDLYEPEAALKILAQWCGVQVIDKDGKRLV